MSVMRNKLGSYWTDEQYALLKELYINRFAPREIARKMGTTRNAVLGKIFRLKKKGELK